MGINICATVSIRAHIMTIATQRHIKVLKLPATSPFAVKEPTTMCLEARTDKAGPRIEAIHTQMVGL